jgi:transposase
MSRMAPALLPDEAREAIDALLEHLDGLEQRIDKVEARILDWHKSNEASQRLASAPGVGPMTATAIVAAVGDGKHFKSSRHFAAWLGLTPRIRTRGRKESIGRISKGGDRYLRTLPIHGARAVVGTLFGKDVRPRPWLGALTGRRPVNVAATAVAHKTSRALWVMLTRAERYHAPVMPAAA